MLTRKLLVTSYSSAPYYPPRLVKVHAYVGGRGADLEGGGRVSLIVEYGLTCYVMDSCGMDMERLKAAMGIVVARTRVRVS